VLLRVDTVAARAAGTAFRRGNAGTWLAERVAPEHLCPEAPVTPP
jgi:RNA:NAD 2'-phosphotransferase (TPT1/KptA family)